MREWMQITVHEASKENHLPEKIQKLAFSGIGISLIAGIVLTITGPYNTINLPLHWRFIYWTGLCFAGCLGAMAAEPILSKAGIKAPRISIVVLQSILASIVVTTFLIAFEMFQTRPIRIGNIAKVFFYVWVIGITITGIAHLTEASSNNKNMTERSERPSIFERLKPQLRSGTIYALSAEDHYVRVITSNGEDLILMRLSDAIKELGALKGLQVHRSWWVAEGGVKFASKANNKISLELHSGQIAPVSRSNTKSVKEAGWI